MDSDDSDEDECPEITMDEGLQLAFCFIHFPEQRISDQGAIHETINVA